MPAGIICLEKGVALMDRLCSLKVGAYCVSIALAFTFNLDFGGPMLYT